MSKLKSHRILIILTLVLVITFTSFSCLFSQKTNALVLEKNNKKWGYNDCENLIAFIDNNFERFVCEYNSTVSGEELLRANSIEHSSIIWLVEDDNYGIFIDFNGSNGYVVITGDYNIYDLQVKGDYEFLRDTDDLYYSYLDGFLYKDENGAYQAFETKIAEEANSSEKVQEKTALVANSSDTKYPGQSKAGDGEIDSEKIEEYVTERYPDYTYETKVNSLVDGFKFSDQYETSYYVKEETNKEGKVIGFTWSEGNCALNSLYMVMNSWQEKGIVKNLPTSTTNINDIIKQDSLYNYYGKGIVREGEPGGKASKAGNSGGDSTSTYYKWHTNTSYNLKKMPTLYTKIRDYAVSKYGYNPEIDFKFDNTMAIGEYVANTLYGNKINIEKTSSISSALNNIDKKSVFLGINNSSTYGNHGVAIIGYYKYSCKSGWWIFSSTKYAYFYEIADGWNSTPQFFDPNTSAKPLTWAYYLA